jgi:ribosomal protein S27E
MAHSSPKQHEYPRITLRCKCHNEFNINVIRLKNREPVSCQVCGEVFPTDLGEQFANALYDMFRVKHGLDKVNSGFNISFVYKSTFKQPPGPLGFLASDFPDEEHASVQ